MSRSSGSKRKIGAISSGNSNDEEGSGPNTAVIDPDLENEITLINDGTHPRLQEKLEALERAKENKLAAADRHRKMMIKNANQHYEYEIEDTQALFNKALREMQELLVEEITKDRARRLAKQREAEAEALLQFSKDSSNSSSADGDSDDRAAATSGRSLRSTATANTTAPAAANGDDVSIAGGRQGNGSSNGNGSSCRSSRRKGGSALSLELELALPEEDMRSDFMEIVRDLHSRAAAYEQSRPKQADVQVRLSGDLSELFILDEAYGMGDMVCVFSVLSQENITGIITALSHREIVVRTGTGARFSVLVGQLRSGRVTMTKDQEMQENAHFFNAAAEIDQLLHKHHRQQ